MASKHAPTHAPQQTPPAEQGRTASSPKGGQEQNDVNPAALQAEARGAFSHDLEGLLRTDPGKWVAYRGRDRVCSGASQSAVYEECRRRGLAPEELLVEMVYAAATEEPTVFLSPPPDFLEEEA